MNGNLTGRDDIEGAGVDSAALQLVEALRVLDSRQIYTFRELLKIVQPRPGAPDRKPISDVFTALNMLCVEVAQERKR